MTLSHYQKLFQNGRHIFQNNGSVLFLRSKNKYQHFVGYWSLKEGVPSPYLLDPLTGEDSPTSSGKRKYNDDDEASTSNGYSGSHTSTSTVEPSIKKIALDRTTTFSSAPTAPPNVLPIPSIFSPYNICMADNPFAVEGARVRPSPNNTQPKPAAVRMTVMKTEIERFKREMGELQQEIDGLQEQVRVKNAEE